MDSVPYEFIERTVLLVAFPGHSNHASFRSLQGHWGRYANHLAWETVYCAVVVNIHHLPYLYDWVSMKNTPWGRVSIEEILGKKNINVCDVQIRSDPKFGPMDEKDTDLVRRVLRRSNGRTHLYVPMWPNDMRELAPLLTSIPRIGSISASPETKCVAVLRPLVEKHLQRGCLTALDLRGKDIPPSFFPIVRSFFEKSEVYIFDGSFSVEDEDLVKKTATLLAATCKRQMAKLHSVNVKASQNFLDELKKEIRRFEGEWEDKLDLYRELNHEPGTIITVTFIYR